MNIQHERNLMLNNYYLLISTSFIVVSRRRVNVDPIEAITIAIKASTCWNASVSPRKIIPETAASAGSMLISVPKVRVGKRVRAIISRE